MKGNVLLEEQKKGALVIDVRKTEQYAEGHIKDAKNIPLATIADEITKVEPNKDKNYSLLQQRKTKATSSKEITRIGT